MYRTWRLSVALALVGTMVMGGYAAAQYPPPPPPAPEAPAIAQVRAGDALMAQGDYRGAAAQYEAAYAVDPALPILERLADAYRLAGDSMRAAELYQRISAIKGGQPVAPPPPQPYVAPSPLPQPIYYSRAPVARPPGTGLLNAGVAMFIAGYGVAIVGGAITMGAAYSTGADSSWYGAGGMLFIPVAGPFATIAYRSDIYWAAPWAVLSGGLQLGGLALLITGAAIKASHKNRPPATQPANRPMTRAFDWNLAPYANQQGGGLTLAATF